MGIWRWAVILMSQVKCRCSARKMVTYMHHGDRGARVRGHIQIPLASNMYLGIARAWCMARQIEYLVSLAGSDGVRSRIGALAIGKRTFELLRSADL